MSRFEDQVADLLTGGDRLVTQYMHDWDGVMKPWAVTKVARQEIRDNSPAGDRSVGTGRIRPSNLDSECSRLHVFSWLGAPKMRGNTILMDDGTQRHYYWQKVGLSAGFLTDIEMKVEVPELAIAGGIDGLMVDGSVFELKTTGPTLYKRAMAARQPTRAHLRQTHAYMKALGTKKASIVYEHRSWSVDWHEFRIDFDPVIYQELVDLSHPVIVGVDEHVLPDMLPECQSLSGPTFKGCDYHHICPSASFTTSW
jgi:hypothetical protein